MPRPAIETVPRVGGTKRVRLDRLREAAPTHVLVNVDENTREDVDAMAGFVPHVIVTHPLAPTDNPRLRVRGDLRPRGGGGSALRPVPGGPGATARGGGGARGAGCSI